MVFSSILDFQQQLLPSGGHSYGEVHATRFAPSPNGQLHLGHAFSALCAYDFARTHQALFKLRIEDIDGTRSRAEFVNDIVADLSWLGLRWNGPTLLQSDNFARYAEALERLKDMGLLYRCRCTRSDIATAIKATPVIHGPDGLVYPGTCKQRDVAQSEPHCWRLDMAKAAHLVGTLTWVEMDKGTPRADFQQFGDVVLWRKDAPASYHLAATVDDAADGISHVVRGRDLFAYTAIHRLLQQLLGLPEPAYWHHPLLLDASGEKLAKSKSSPALSLRRLAGEDGRLLIDNLRKGVLPLGISMSDT
jgi:glutamyl-Q tRNA(Asp) synthetase